MEDAMEDLDSKIAALRKEVKSDRLSMSIGELAGIYEKGEIDVHPKFQRILRWSDEQKSKLIESILLRIPIPPIFVAQDTGGKWDVVDGVQRLGTILQFLGMFRDDRGKLQRPLRLSGTELLPELGGYYFLPHNNSKAFSISQQLDFKRSRLDFQIVLNESDPAAKYELFERLNTGGSIASDQEVRNCIMVWQNEAFFDWFKEKLVDNPSFKECVQLTERLEEQQYRSELVLRFLVFSRMDDTLFPAIDDLGEFLNLQNRSLATNTTFDKSLSEQIFADSFRIINGSLGADAFRKFDDTKGAFQGPFLISAFEAVALGVAHNIDRWKRTADYERRLNDLVRRLWSEKGFIGHIGIGIAARTRIRHSIPFGRKFFRP
jgi:hypothetical protein